MVKKKRLPRKSKKGRPIARRKSKASRRIKRPTKTRKLKVKKESRGVAALEKIGAVTHYFPKVKAAAVKIMKNSLRIGDHVYVKGHTTDFKQGVTSLQLDRVPIEEGKKGKEIGMLVKSRVRIGDSVYKL